MPLYSGGGGGDGGWSAPVVSLSVLGNGELWDISSDGFFLEDASVSSDDGSVTVFIPDLTQALGPNGLPVTQITVNTIDPPPAPEGMHILAAFAFEPSGASFNPGIEITIAFDPSEVAEGETVAIAFFNAATGAWEIVEGTVADGIATFTVNHFTVFAVLSGTADQSAPDALAPAPTATAAPAHHHSQKSGGIDPVVWAGIAVGIMLTVEILWLLFRRRS